MGERFKTTWRGWIHSSDGYSVRVRGRTGLDYRDLNGGMRIDIETMSSPSSDVVVHTDSIADLPQRRRAEVLDRLRRVSEYAGWRLVLLPARDEMSRRLDDPDVHVLTSLLGQTILSVDSMAGGIVESAYLRLADVIVELAAVERGFRDRGFPWRISAKKWTLETVFDAPLLTNITDVGTVTSIDVFSDAGDVEAALAIRLTDGRTLWASCAGGDFVAPELGDEQSWAGLPGWKVSRTL